MENATEQAANAVIYVTEVPMSWPEALIAVGCAFAVGFIIYYIPILRRL